MRSAPLALVLSACAATVQSEPTVCDQLCDELVGDCAFPAWPTREDCMQGCGWFEGEGVDVAAYQACVAEAECDAFAIVECEHAHGIENL